MSMKRSNIALLLIIWIGIVLIFLMRGTKTQNIDSTKEVSNGLKGAVENSLQGSYGTYAVAVKNLKSGESYYLNENKVFSSGSLYKLWVMVTVFEQIEKNILNENEPLSQDVSELNSQFNISPEDADLTEGEITLSVKDALEQMITISHNYAALMLIEKIKRLEVEDFLKKSGFESSTIGDNLQTTAKETALFFEKLYNGEFANPETTAKMTELLKKQTKNEKLPKYLPSEVTVAHKTGEIGSFSHDGGIVYTPNGDYIIVVLSESDNPYGAEERIAQISKAVYEYFERR